MRNKAERDELGGHPLEPNHRSRSTLCGTIVLPKLDLLHDTFADALPVPCWCSRRISYEVPAVSVIRAGRARQHDERCDSDRGGHSEGRDSAPRRAPADLC